MNSQISMKKQKLSKKRKYNVKEKEEKGFESDSDEDKNNNLYNDKNKFSKKKCFTKSSGYKLDEESDQDESGNKPKLKLQEDLSGMSFGDLISLKNKLGTKVFNCTAFKSSDAGQHEIADTPPLSVTQKSKNKPIEMSSKVKARARKAAVRGVKTYTSRDPRFEETSGPLKRELFQRSYSFIEDLRINEKKKLMKRAKKERDPEVKSSIESLLKRMKQQEKSKSQQEEAIVREKARRKEERVKVLQGKKPYFLKKSEQRRQLDEERQQRLQQTGGLQKYLKRKDKKQLAKDRKKLSFL